MEKAGGMKVHRSQAHSLPLLSRCLVSKQPWKRTHIPVCRHTHTHRTLNTDCEPFLEPLLPSTPLSVSCIPVTSGEVGQRWQPDTASKEEFTSVTVARHSPVQ